MPRSASRTIGASFITASTAAVILLAGFLSPARAGVVEAYAVSLGGASGPVGPCTTYGAPSVESDMFSGGSGVSLPGDGTSAGITACGVTNTIVSNSAPSGAQNAAVTLPTVTFGNPGATNSFSGSAQASANTATQQLRSEAHGIGSSIGNTFNSPTITQGSEGIAAIDQRLTVHSASKADGTAGFVTIGYHVNGSASNVGAGGSFSEQLHYAVGGVKGFAFLNGAVSADLSLNGPGTGSKSGEFFTFAIPVVFGTAFDFRVAFMTDALPGHDDTVDIDFFSTATLDQIAVTAGGGAVTDFVVDSDSGAVLGANGVISTTVPEPGSLVLFASALGLGLLRRRRGN